MINKVKKFFSQNFINALGYRGNRKFLIIESDDWGSIRMRSNESYKRLERAGAIISKDSYNIYDKLEESKDFSELFDTLINFRDLKGNCPCITTNTIMANPDFEKIKESGFQVYYSIGLKESYEKYSDGNAVRSLLLDGIAKKIIVPQFHGKQHLNVPLWLDALKKNDKNTIAGFNEHVFSLSTEGKVGYKSNYMAAFEVCSLNSSEEISESIRSGLLLFNHFFEYNSKTMISPSYIWDSNVEKVAASHGVEGIQGISYQYVPTNQGMHKRFHYTGQKNRLGQIYLVRNAFFEPTLEPNTDVVDICLARIENAFKWGKPAIIGSHRLNFMGGLNELNRDKNLKLLKKLLIKVLKQWPDVEFISSDQLISIMNGKSQK